MVSTRQMATSHSGGSSSSSCNNGSTSSGEDGTRLTLLNVLMPPQSATATGQVHRGEIQAVAGPSACNTRQMQVSPSGRSLSTSTVGSGTSLLASSSSSDLIVDTVRNDANAHMDNFVRVERSLLDLPPEILNKIFSYLSYRKIGQLRLVSHKINDVSMHILNMTFSKMLSQTYNHFQAIKSKMPRRESARRSHPLACECDIIETCYMRLSLLQMTLGKHIERGHCCFFPGAILDEVLTILHYIKSTPRLERPFSVTDELFDLSTMAMEYFRDRIEGTLPGIAYFKRDYFKLTTTPNGPPIVMSADLTENTSSLSTPPQSNMVLRKGIRKIEQGMKIYNNQLSVLRNELRTTKRKAAEHAKQMAEQQRLMSAQQKQTVESVNRMDEMEKKNEEMSRKFSTLLQELNKCKTELLYWRSKSPVFLMCKSCGHKMSPALPPDEYHALMSQYMNLNEGIEGESNTDGNANDSNAMPNTEFGLTDETATTTTTNIANTAVKASTANTCGSRSVKRQYYQISNNNSTSNNTNTNMNTNTSTVHCMQACGETTSNMTAAAATVVGAGTAAIAATVESTNCQAYAKGGQIIRTTDSHSQAQDKDLNMTTTVAKIGDDNNVSVFSGSGSNSGYPTKLFYGTQAHAGVIVSPSMLAKRATEPEGGTINCNAIANSTGGNDATDGISVGVGAGAGVGVSACSGALQAIKSQETKKARKVQKATRCAGGASGTSNSCKRSK